MDMSKVHCKGQSADLLLVLQSVLSALQAVLQVGFLRRLGSLCREQQLRLCLQLRRSRHAVDVVIMANALNGFTVL